MAFKRKRLCVHIWEHTHVHVCVYVCMCGLVSERFRQKEKVCERGRERVMKLET